MKIMTYFSRFFLALLFIYAGIEKLFLTYDPEAYRAMYAGSADDFFEFYELMHYSDFLHFVGFCQLLCGLLLVFKRTYLLGAIMLMPIVLCILMTQIYFSKYALYLVFVLVVFGLNAFLIMRHLKDLKAVLFTSQKSLL